MALIPIKDDNKLSEIKFQYVTVVFIAACIGVFLWQLTLGSGENRVIYGYGSIPAVLFGTKEMSPGLIVVPEYLTLVTSIFFHGGWMHIIFNMLFLWVFGDNVEDVMGPIRFVVFYLLCGLAAAFAQIGSDTDSIIPMVGASGAIGGVMGAYALLFPRVKVNTLIFLGFSVTTLRVPAIFMLGYWFVLQLLQGLPALGSTQGGVAFWAHIGGFLAGIALIYVFRRSDYRANHTTADSGSAPRDDSRWF